MIFFFKWGWFCLTVRMIIVKQRGVEGKLLFSGSKDPMKNWYGFLIFKCISEALWLWEMVSGTLPLNNAVS